ncbi:MAG: hypothetical protein ACYTG0_32015 [Planctomycetota bacterium]|jgi:hypothetical protein
MSTVYRKKYEAFVARARRNLMQNQQDKQDNRTRGIGPDVGLTPEFVDKKVGKWFLPDGRWQPNFGLSLVALVRTNEQWYPNRVLYQNLVRAQTKIGEVLKDAWRGLPQEQLPVTLCPIDVNPDLDHPRRDPIRAGVIENRIKELGHKFSAFKREHLSPILAVDFLGVFQSPLDGRLNAWGIPTTCAHHSIIKAMREDIGEQKRFLPLVHIALGSIVEPISAGLFGYLHMIVDSQLSGYEKCGTFVVERVTLVHHANDHMDGLGTTDRRHWELLP